MSRVFLKYLEVARTTLRSRFAYVWDQLLASLHLALIMYVFVQLWKVTFAAQGTGEINGYTLAEMVWYLVFTEGIIMSLPRIHSTLEAEVKGGDLAVRLNKPYNYLLFHYSAFSGEGLFRLVVALAVGGLVACLGVGGVAFRWEALPVMLLVYLLTQVMHFAYNSVIGLAAFWVEDVSGLYFVLDRVKWMLGGMLLPVEVYPDSVRWVVEALPFRHMIAGPARLFVKYDGGAALDLLGSQALWATLFVLVTAAVYRLGVRRVDIHGG